MDITLGLDFGTHQSKLCMRYMPNNEPLYEFLEFPIDGGGKSVFLPSEIQINKDDTIRIGSVDFKKCVIKSIPKPKKPILPPQPKITYPKEPDRTIPREPKEIRPPEFVWDSGIGGKKKKKKKKPSKNNEYFIREHRKWEEKCQIIEQKHRRWEYECRMLDLKLIPWRRRCKEIQSDYERRCVYWETHQTEYRILKYFKQAALTETLHWNDEIQPDMLSIWYITYLLLFVKRVVKERFGEKFEESVSVQMGIPSGLNDEISQEIHHRGLKLLVTARLFMGFFDNPEDMCRIPYPRLIDMTKCLNVNVKKDADEFGLIVIPEAFAGLQSLTNSRRLTRGNLHLLVDIGGGTTDIAFFTINESLKPSIHTMISFHKGLNFVIEQYVLSNPNYSIEEARERLFLNTNEFNSAISIFKKELEKRISEVVTHIGTEYCMVIKGTSLSITDLINAMENRPIVYCGGGSLYENMRVSHEYFSEKRLIDKDMLNIPHLQNKNLNRVLFTILATAYGLSIPLETEIKNIDVRKFWSVIADGARIEKKEKGNDYGLQDD